MARKMTINWALDMLCANGLGQGCLRDNLEIPYLRSELERVLGVIC